MANTQIEHLRIAIRETLQVNGDEGYARQMKAYMKGKFEFYGLTAGDRRTTTKDLIKESRKLSVDHRFQLAEALWQEHYRECHYTAMDILSTIETKIDESYLSRVENLIMTNSWWDTVDWLASHLVGSIYRKTSSEREVYLNKWLSSEDIWLNRSCLIYQLFYREDTNFERLKDYIYALEHKKEFFIQKAIGWALRQYSKSNAYAVEEFVNDQPIMSNLARREAMKHINRSR